MTKDSNSNTTISINTVNNSVSTPSIAAELIDIATIESTKFDQSQPNQKVDNKEILPHEEFNQKVKKVINDTSNKPFSFVAGALIRNSRNILNRFVETSLITTNVLLRNFWERVPTLSLPTADASDSKKKPESKTEDQDFNQLLNLYVREGKIKFATDEDYDSFSKEEKAEYVATVKNVINQFKLAASESRETRELILYCLKNVKNFEFYDKRFESKGFRDSEDVSDMFENANLKNSGEIQISVQSNIIDLIIHECTHLKDITENLTNDRSKLIKCGKNIDNLIGEIGNFLISGKKIVPSNLKKVSDSYEHRGQNILVQTEEGSDFIAYEIGDYSLYAKLDKIDNSGHYDYGSASYHSYSLHSIENKKTGKSRTPNTMEKDLFKAYVNLLGVSDMLNVDYEDEVSQTLEEHAVINEVPRPIIENICSKQVKDDFGSRKVKDDWYNSL